jgi:acyl carrier protein
MLARNRYEVAAAVRRLVSETLAVPLGDVNEETLIVEDLHATSMDIVTVAMTLDDYFGIEFELSELPNLNVSVRWIIDYICSRENSA